MTRILVLRPGAIGDTLLALPALLALRARYPGAHVTVVGNRVALPLVEAAGGADAWLSFDDPRVTRMFMPVAPLSDDLFLGCDVGVAWGRDPDGVLRASFARRGARQIVVAPSRPGVDDRVHAARHLVQTLAPLGLDPTADLLLPTFDLPVDVLNAADQELRAVGLASRSFVAVHVGSGSPTKNWPAERFSEVVDALQAELGLPCVVLGGPADAEALIVLRERADCQLAVFDGRSLLVVAAILRRACAFLGNDSGLSHLAGMLGVPSLVLFGPSDSIHWLPLGPRVHHVRSDPLTALPADRVMAELHALVQIHDDGDRGLTSGC
jgi:ADP-heptose:LPS heptosyltransferase